MGLSCHAEGEEGVKTTTCKYDLSNKHKSDVLFYSIVFILLISCKCGPNKVASQLPEH